MDGARDELFARAALAQDEHGDIARGDPVHKAQELAHRLATPRDLVVAIARRRCALDQSELRSGDVELGLALAEQRLNPRARSVGPARGAPEEHGVARVGDGHRGLGRDDPHPRELARPERAFATSVIEVNDAERLAPREKRHSQDAAQAKRMHARMKVAERGKRICGDDGVARLDGATRDRVRERQLFAADVTAGQVASGPSDQAASGGGQEKQASLDPGPEHECIEHLLEQRSKAIAPGEGTNDRFEARDLRRLEDDTARARVGARRAGPRHAREGGPQLGRRAVTQRASGRGAGLVEAPRPLTVAHLGRQAKSRVERGPA